MDSSKEDSTHLNGDWCLCSFFHEHSSSCLFLKMYYLLFWHNSINWPYIKPLSKIFCVYLFHCSVNAQTWLFRFMACHQRERSKYRAVLKCFHVSGTNTLKSHWGRLWTVMRGCQTCVVPVLCRGKHLPGRSQRFACLCHGCHVGEY